MSSKRGGGKSDKGKNIVGVSDSGVDQLNPTVQDVNLDGKKKKKRAGNVVASKKWASQRDGGLGNAQVRGPKKACATQTGGRGDAKNQPINRHPYENNCNAPSNAIPPPLQTGHNWNSRPGNAWQSGTGGRGNARVRAPKNACATQTGGRGDAKNQPINRHPYENNCNAPSEAIPPPLQTGQNWNSRPAYPWQSGIDAQRRENGSIPQPLGVEEDADDHNDNDALDEFESESELHSDDEYYSDESPESHEERKQNRWFYDFFETLDTLTVDQINEPTRQWHCPACQNGPGAIDWYCSLQSLVTHAKTKGSKRVKIHRDLARVLEDELRVRGATVNPAGESFGQWKGLNEVVKDKEIVWPPMVVIMNTQLEQDENEKWVGMGNPELLDYFGSYEAVKARHSYGPKGHRGMSVLIFESSAVGYTEAERLSKHFEQQGTDRYAWDHHPVLFYPGGKRQLYGYMATKRDMDVFNQHSHGKSKLKFEMVSYQEKVVDQLKQMNEENQQLHWFKTKEAKDQMHVKALEEAIGFVSQKLRKKEVEDRIVRERSQQYHEENKEAMDSLEQFFKDQLKLIQDRSAKESQFNKMQQEELRRVEQSLSAMDPRKREEKLEEMKEFEEEREKLKSMYWKKKIELEEWFDGELTRLMEKHTHKN